MNPFSPNYIILLFLVSSLACFLFYGRMLSGEIFLFVRSTIGWLLLFVLPGYLFIRISFKDEKLNLLEVFPLSFALGIALFAPIGFLAYYFNWKALPLFAYVLSLVFVFGSLGLKYRCYIPKIDKKLLALFVGLALISIFFYYAKSFQNPFSDSTVHLTYIRKIVSNSIANSSVFFVSQKDQFYDFTNTAYFYNVWYQALSLVSSVTAVAPVYVWVFFPSLFVFLILLAYWSLAKQIFQSEKYAYGVVLYYLTFSLIPLLWTIKAAPYPDQIGKLLLTITILLILKYLSNSESWILPISIYLLCFSLPLVHISSFMYLCFILFCYLVFLLLFGKDWVKCKRIMFVLGMGILVSLPSTIAKGLVYQRAHMNTQASFFVNAIGDGVVNISESLYFVNPKVFFSSSLGLLIIIVFILAIFKTFNRKCDGTVFLLSGMIGVILLLCNPFLVPLFSLLITPVLLRRFFWIWEYLGGFLAGYYLIEIFIYCRSYCRSKITSMLFVGCFVVLSLSFVAWQNIRSVEACLAGYAEMGLNRFISERIFDHRLTDAVKQYSFIAKYVPEGSVLLADRANTRMISSLFAINAVMPFHIITPKEEELSLVCGRVFADGCNVKEIRSSLRKYQVDYVLFPSSFDSKNVKENNIFAFIYKDNNYLLCKAIRSR